MSDAAWDRRAFEGKLDDVAYKIADLWAIDAVIKEQEGVPEGTLVTAGVETKLGRSEPFTIFLKYNATTFEGGKLVKGPSVQEWLQEYYDVGDAWAKMLVAGIRAAAHRQIVPVAASFDDAAAVIKDQIVDSVETMLDDHLLMLGHSLSEWHGHSADDFFDYTYDRIEPAARSQAFIGAAINYGVKGAGTIVKLGQDSLMQLVSAVDDALGQQLHLRAVDYRLRKESAAEWLGLVAGYIGLALAIPATLPTGGTSLELTAGVLGLGGTSVGLASRLTDKDASESNTITSVDAEGLATELDSGVSKILKNVGENWHDLELHLAILRRHVTQAARRDDLYPQPPDLDHISPVTFHHESVTS